MILSLDFTYLFSIGGSQVSCGMEQQLLLIMVEVFLVFEVTTFSLVTSLLVVVITYNVEEA